MERGNPAEDLLIRCLSRLVRRDFYYCQLVMFLCLKFADPSLKKRQLQDFWKPLHVSHLGSCHHVIFSPAN